MKDRSGNMLPDCCFHGMFREKKQKDQEKDARELTTRLTGRPITL